MSGGIILLDKPAGMTSMACDSFIKRTVGTKKVGHSGTLDPFATGLLPVFWGDALKVVRYTDGYDKAYRCTAFFGSETDTEDTEGQVTGGRMPSEDELSDLKASDFALIRKAFAEVASSAEQMPPLYSAKKIGGRKAYEIARAGEIPELQPHRIRIDSLDITGIEIKDGGVLVTFDVACSKGTYIRSICRDAGRITGFGAHAVSLRRPRSGPFCVEDARTPDEIRAVTEGCPDISKAEFSISRERAFDQMPVLQLQEKQFQDIKLGRKIGLPSEDMPEGTLYRAMYDGKTAAVVFRSDEEGKKILRIDRMLWKDE